jgi:hypothetical protein
MIATSLTKSTIGIYKNYGKQILKKFCQENNIGKFFENLFAIIFINQLKMSTILENLLISL